MDTSTRLFLRFRGRADGRALGRLFDRVAPGLRAVALHLAPEPSGADDLVQTTFLKAIEGRATFDAGRPVEPWLYGILAREAAGARRRAARPIDGERVAPGHAAPDPGEAAERAEAARLVGETIDGLPAPYGPVLSAFLKKGQTPKEIASAAPTGASPGQVRVQIGRGLELLRRRLPKGVALGAAPALDRGSPGMRQSVLARAQTSGAIGSVPTGAVLAMPWLMGVWQPLAIVAALGAVAATLLLTRPGETRGTAANEVTRADRTGAPGPMTAPSEQQAIGQRREQGQGAAPIEAAPATVVTVDPQAEAAAAGRAELEVTVTSPSGDPVPDAEVRVWPKGSGWLEPPRSPVSGEPLIERWTTDFAGVARCEGLPRGQLVVEVSAEGYALGTPLLTPPMENGELRSVEIALKREHVLRGTVTDADGQPLEGVRVTARKLSTDTDASGNYELRQLGRGALRARVFGTNGLLLQPAVHPVDGELPRLDVSMPRVRPVSGKLMDHRGDAAVGWFVRAHFQPVRGPGAPIMDPLTFQAFRSWERTSATDAEGRFRLEEIPEGSLVLSAQPVPTYDPGEPLGVFRSVLPGTSNALLQLDPPKPAMTITGRLAVSEGPAPVRWHLTIGNDRTRRGIESDGTPFRFRSIDPSADRVTLWMNHSFRVDSKAFDWAAGETLDLGDWEIPTPGAVALRFADGSPAGGETVWRIEPLDPSAAPSVTSALVGSVFALGLPPGLYRPTSETCDTPQPAFEIKEGRLTTAEVTIAPRPLTTVKLVARGNRPVDGRATVEVILAGTNEVLSTTTCEAGAGTRVDLEQCTVLVRATLEDGRKGIVVCEATVRAPEALTITVR